MSGWEAGEERKNEGKGSISIRENGGGELGEMRGSRDMIRN